MNKSTEAAKWCADLLADHFTKMDGDNPERKKIAYIVGFLEMAFLTEAHNLNGVEFIDMVISDKEAQSSFFRGQDAAVNIGVISNPDEV